jgi:trigger factor
MNVVVEQLPNCLATLKVEVEPEKVSSARNELVSEFGKAARIPGFRPGKAPRAAIEKRFKKQIREELEKKLVQDSAREAIRTKGLRVLQVASVDDVEIPEMEGSGASFTATLVTQPEFELPNYKGLVVQMRGTDVTEEEIDKSLEQLRDQGADFVDIAADRGAQMDDFIVVDYQGSISGQPVHEVFPKAGKPLTANDDFWIKMTDEAFFPGFCQALLGARPGETREFDVTVPADFPVEGMPGQVIHYTVTVKGLKEKTLPALDDAFADSVAKGKTLAELRELARQEIGRQKKNDAEAGKRADIMKELLSNVECELPTSLVRAHTQSIINDIVRENTARGVAEDILKENEKDIVASATANARERLKGTFVLLRVAEQEGLRVTQEELLGRVAAMAQRYQMTFEKMLKELQSRNGLDQIQEEMLTAKALDFLVANASVTTAPVAPTAAS